MTKDEWTGTISDVIAQKTITLTAVTFLKGWNTDSKPVALQCSDGQEYVIKGRHSLSHVGKMERVCTNEQVVARIGKAMGAPVSDVALVEVSQQFIDINPSMSHMMAGICHGCKLISDCSEREALDNLALPENRERFARLSVLFGIMQAGDYQLFYKTFDPKLVFSFDHGFFFPGGPQWTIASLQNALQVTLDAWIANGASLTDNEKATALDQLRLITQNVIAEAVGAPSDEWLTLDERAELAVFIERRVSYLLPVAHQGN